MYAYISPPAMVHLSKPAHWGDPAFTDKTGGCNCEASVLERMCVDWPAREPGCTESNRWCCPQHKTNLSTGMRKGSVQFRRVAPKRLSAMLVVSGNVAIC
jgi:hypothetical protein